MKLSEFKKELMKDPEIKKEFERFDLLWELEKIWWNIKYFIWKIIER